jgi:hypothetical protein
LIIAVTATATITTMTMNGMTEELCILPPGRCEFVLATYECGRPGETTGRANFCVADSRTRIPRTGDSQTTSQH